MVVGVLALTGWLGWSAYRSAMLWRAAITAVEARAWDRVEAALARRVWYRPRDLDAIQLRVEAALQSGDRDAVARALSTVPDWSELAESAHAMRGRMLKELYRPAEAIDELRACLRKNPRRVEAIRELIAIFGIQRRAREQTEQLWALHDRGGSAIEALRTLAQPIPIIPPGALAKNADEGFVLRRCLETKADDPSLPAPLAYFLRNRGQVAEARALLEPWLEGLRAGPEMRLEDLACLLDQGDVASTRPWFERSDESLGAHSRYWLLRGDWFHMQDRNGEALGSYREAVRRDPRSADARYRLAQALRTMGLAREADEAVAYHQRLVQLSLLAARISETAPDPSLLAQAARLCHNLGRDREARAWYAALLRVAPSDGDARRSLSVPAPLSTGPNDGTPAGQGRRDPQP
jgi:tetratricopeptide (TPR) repeat protein